MEGSDINLAQTEGVEGSMWATSSMKGPTGLEPNQHSQKEQMNGQAEGRPHSETHYTLSQLCSQSSCSTQPREQLEWEDWGLLEKEPQGVRSEARSKHTQSGA